MLVLLKRGVETPLLHPTVKLPVQIAMWHHDLLQVYMEEKSHHSLVEWYYLDVYYICKFHSFDISYLYVRRKLTYFWVFIFGCILKLHIFVLSETNERTLSFLEESRSNIR